MLKRIYTLIIAVLVIAVLTTGLVAIQVISSFIDRDNRNTLLSAARLIQQDMDSGLTAAEASQRTMQIFSQANAAIRVTVVDRLGKVLFDNEAEPGQMDNHLRSVLPCKIKASVQQCARAARLRRKCFTSHFTIKPKTSSSAPPYRSKPPRPG
jgi:Tfp pilus assembly protein PilV